MSHMISNHKICIPNGTRIVCDLFFVRELSEPGGAFSFPDSLKWQPSTYSDDKSLARHFWQLR